MELGAELSNLLAKFTPVEQKNSLNCLKITCWSELPASQITSSQQLRHIFFLSLLLFLKKMNSESL